MRVQWAARDETTSTYSGTNGVDSTQDIGLRADEVQDDFLSRQQADDDKGPKRASLVQLHSPRLEIVQNITADSASTCLRGYFLPHGLSRVINILHCLAHNRE